MLLIYFFTPSKVLERALKQMGLSEEEIMDQAPNLWIISVALLPASSKQITNRLSVIPFAVSKSHLFVGLQTGVYPCFLDLNALRGPLLPW